MLINYFLFNKLIELIEIVLDFNQPTDYVLSLFFKKNKNIGQKDRMLITEYIYFLLRHRELILFFLKSQNQWSKKNELICTLFLFNPNKNNCDDWLNENEKKLLISFISYVQIEQKVLSVQSELPTWISEKLSPVYHDEEIIALGQSFQKSAPLDIRVNLLKEKRENVFNTLKKEGYQVEKTPYSPWGIRFENKESLHFHPLFLDGKIEIQDEGSQLIAIMSQAKRNQLVIDFCAGAGGKTLALGVLMANQGSLYALDIHESRLKQLKERLSRSGLSIVNPIVIEHEHSKKLDKFYQKADCVLIDAPCSGLGTLRRNPDLKYRQSAKTIEALTKIQRNILQSASRLVKKNGLLIYATCSILPEENQNQIDDFLKNHPEFELVDCHSLLKSIKIESKLALMLAMNPLEHQTDGFFIAVMKHNPI